MRRLGSAATTAALLAVPVVFAAPAHAYSSQQWALDYLKATQDWQVSKGSGVTVAVLDSGVASIPDLSGQVVSGADFSSGPSSSGNGETDTDNDGHGTGMAVVIAGNGGSVTGLAPSAKILPVRIDASSASGLFAQNVAAGIQYAVSQHVGVINLSIGGHQDLGAQVSSAIAQAVAANIVVVAATGNDGTSTVDFPAAYPGVVAVGAIDQSGQVWSQSNTGSQVALVAPGVNIYRDNNFGQQGTSNGTSEATAYVSATAALIRGAHPDWTAGQVIRDLISTATPGSGQAAGQHSDQYGYGVVTPLKALQASAPSDTSNPLLGPGSAATAGANVAPGASATSGSTSAAPTSGSHTGLIVSVIVGFIVLVGIILLVTVLSRRGRGPKPPAGPGPGYGNHPQQPYQQSNPYAQQNPYQQGPGPGSGSDYDSGSGSAPGQGQAQSPYQQRPYGQGQPPYPPQQ